MNNREDYSLALIRKVINRNNLSSKETETLFSDIFLNDKKGYFFTSLITALHTKGETADELFGFCNSTKKLGEKITPNIPIQNITDLSGTGGSLIKTINISTAASFIVSSAGYSVAKQAGYAVTSPTGSGDIFQAFGINTFALNPSIISNTLEKVGICPIFLSAISPKLKNRSLIAKKVFVENDLRIPSLFHLAAFAYSPTPLKKRIYVCFSERYLDTLAELFQKLGNEKTYIIHGVGGIPEVSVIGKTIVIEQNNNKMIRKEYSPEDFGMPSYPVDSIRTGGKEQNIIEFLRIIHNLEKGAKKDMIIANAALSLQVMGKVNNPLDGARLALEILQEGLAANKLKSLITSLGDLDLYHNWLLKAGISK